jgi:hypothetical protein
MLKQFFKSNSKLQTPTIGSNSQIVSQLHALEIEKDILTKTIARLYQNETDLTKIQKDRLLLKYQHQLGIVITRIEKLQNASKHPDLGPLGDGLITLMDQKLSQLDQRLYELTSKIQVAQSQNDVSSKTNEKKPSQVKETIKEKTKPVFEKPIEEFVNKSSKKFEITTLTSLPKLDPIKQSKYDQMLSQLSSDVITPPPMKPKIETSEIDKQEIVPIIEDKPQSVVEQTVKPVLNETSTQVIEIPEESEIDDENDDIEEIKSKILKTLSKIEQAEVD